MKRRILVVFLLAALAMLTGCIERYEIENASMPGTASVWRLDHWSGEVRTFVLYEGKLQKFCEQ